jgi:hypothetical protein
MHPSGRSFRLVARTMMVFAAGFAVYLAAPAGVMAAPPDVAAARGGGGSTPGYDISYPQCGGLFPANAAFGIVGVNKGIVFSPNPCLGNGNGPSELAWAGGVQAQLYANTGNPGPGPSIHWPNGQTFPLACNTGTSPGSDTRNCAYDYGWNAATDSYQTAVRAYISLGLASAGATSTPQPNRWWLDVETGNSWRTDASLNVAALQGAVAYLQSVGALGIGFYSTQSQWNQITGGTAVFSPLPSWVAGATSARQAASNCTGSAFTRGVVAIAQYFAKGFDADLPC